MKKISRNTPFAIPLIMEKQSDTKFMSSIYNMYFDQSKKYFSRRKD